jgi:hypothetical protein
MIATTALQFVNRHVLDTSLQAARLPVRLAQRLTRQQDNPQWGPTLLAEQAESMVEIWAGALTRDDVLRDRGITRRDRVDQLRRAGMFEELAEETKAEADQQLQERQQQIQEQRKATANAAQQRKAAAKRAAATRKQRSEQSAAKKMTVVRQAEESQEEVIDRLERAGTKAALNAEARALEITREALDADETVEVIDDAIESSAAARARD